MKWGFLNNNAALWITALVRVLYIPGQPVIDLGTLGGDKKDAQSVSTTSTRWSGKRISRAAPRTRSYGTTE